MTAPRSQPTNASPTPWELIAATEHHGPYIVNEYGHDVCDFYAMSNPLAASMRNGGNSYPVHFTDAEANAKLVVEAVNSHATLKARIEELTAALQFIADGYDNHDVNHVDYRVKVYQVALDALGPKAGS